MACKNWDRESYFCSQKGTTINPDELSACQEECEDFVPCNTSRAYDLVMCNDCNTRFEPNQGIKVEVNGREFVRCPKCGSVNISRDDDILNNRSGK